ncbi:MAG: CRTAC1 family protein [Rhodothermales bacterium]
MRVALLQGVIFCALLTVCACGGPAAERPAASEASVRFTDITAEAGLGAFRHRNGGFGAYWMPEIMSGGGGFVDVDDDGDPDVVLVGGGSLPGRTDAAGPALVVYRNDGGSFSDATAALGLAGERAYGQGIAAADYDNDGDTDILLTAIGRNRLYRNDAGLFRDVSDAAGLADVEAWSTSAVFFDADRDGWLDLYIANYLDWSAETDKVCIENGQRDYCNPKTYRGMEDTFYRNRGDGTFENRTAPSGISPAGAPRRGKGLGVIELDMNDDGWSDLYVANDGEPNFLFRNDGAGGFTEVALTSGVAVDQNGTPRAGMGVAAGVVDSTGALSLFVGNFSQEMVGVWRRERGELFEDRAAASRLGFPTLKTLTFGLVLFDADLDTDLDLLAANGHVMQYIADKQLGVSFRQPPQLFLNDGAGYFTEAAAEAGPFAAPLLGRALATADHDGDGDLDVLLTENDGPAHLWRNDTAGGSYLRVRLRSETGNRGAIGARIRATVKGLTMERRIRTGGSFQAQSELVATFGLGGATDVDRLDVTWPDGQTETFQRVAGGREVLIEQGTGIVADAASSGSAP